jgi:RNA polymerase sigma-70 factor (ECF subfamily)
MNEPTDDALWMRVATGETEAFGVLFERHARLIYNYLFRRTGDWSVAEDLTSVVFLEAYRRRASVDMQAGKVLPWLYGVAGNVLRNQRRSMRRYAAALSRLPAPDPELGIAGDAADRIDAARQVRDVLRRLAQLSERDQEVIALCLWSDLSYEEAALALGIPVSAVRTRLSRARARLAALGDVDAREHDAVSEGACES